MRQRSWFVAAITRASTRIVRPPPRRSHCGSLPAGSAFTFTHLATGILRCERIIQEPYTPYHDSQALRYPLGAWVISLLKLPSSICRFPVASNNVGSYARPALKGRRRRFDPVSGHHIFNNLQAHRDVCPRHRVLIAGTNTARPTQLIPSTWMFLKARSEWQRNSA
jgi:hypothetical protein